MLASLPSNLTVCVCWGVTGNTRDNGTLDWDAHAYANAHPPLARGSRSGLQAPKQGRPLAFLMLVAL
jgi:hypothetical protein